MIKELYITKKVNGSNVTHPIDTKDLSITRTYTSPFFSDCTEVYSDGTLTVVIPKTEHNLAVFEYFDREDMNTDIPYSLMKADHYVNGLPIFENAIVNILPSDQDIQTQFVWGISKEKYLPLFTKKCNEIIPNGTTILSDDWIVKWNKNEMYALGKKYKYIDYSSAEIVQDAEVLNGVVQSPAVPPEPYASNMRDMSLHPFVEFNNILDLICADNGINPNEFLPIKNKLTNFGLILGGNVDNYDYELTLSNGGTTETAQDIKISNTVLDAGIFQVTSHSFRPNPLILGLYPITLNMELNFTLTTTTVVNVELWSVDNVTSEETKVLGIPYLLNGSSRIYNCVLNVDVENLNDVYFLRWAATGARAYSIADGGTVKLSFTQSNCMYSLDSALFPGRYNCLANLPQITQMDFIKQMLIITGLFIGYDKQGNIRIYDLNTFVNNLITGNVYDWSGKVSLIQKSTFQFNSNFQKNYIKYNNFAEIVYDNYASIDVSDLTIGSEQDLYTLSFDLAAKSTSGKSELLLYTETVKKTTSGSATTTSFDITYNSKNSVAVKNNLGIARNEDVLPNDSTVKNETIRGFIYRNYGIYKKLVNRPIVKTIEVNLDFFEGANIDFEKPVYIEEWGKYCLVLSAVCVDDEVAVLDVLLINQKFTNDVTTEILWDNYICELTDISGITGTVNYTGIEIPFEINFSPSGSNCSVYLNLTWVFGDGASTSIQHYTVPQTRSHIYTTPGAYEIKLTATNDCGSKTYLQNITIVNKYTGYQRAREATKNVYTNGNLTSTTVYSILTAFTYLTVDYPELTSLQLQSMSVDDYSQRITAFLECNNLNISVSDSRQYNTTNCPI